MSFTLRQKLLALAAGASIIALVAAKSLIPESFPDLVDRTMEGVVYVMAGAVNAEGQHGVAVGTGFFMDSSGLIATNYHVIAGMASSNELRIRTKDSTKWFEASVVGGDPLSDVAFLRIDSWQQFEHEIPYKVLNFAPASKMQVGDAVWAIGMPQGLAWTMTRGFLSASHRKPQPLSPMYYMQTDIRITNGNSGGPLFDMAGNVVGINNMLEVVQGGSIPYAIPSEIVQKIARDLHKDLKKIVWPALGVSYQASPDGVGMLIENLLPDSVLNGKAQVGDTILSVATKFSLPYNLIEEDDLPNHIFVLDTGDFAQLKILSKENKISTINVAVGAGRTSAQVVDAIEELHRQQEKE